jgi:hypothetical protein
MLDLQADNTAYFASEIRADTMTKQWNEEKMVADAKMSTAREQKWSSKLKRPSEKWKKMVLFRLQRKVAAVFDMHRGIERRII